LTFPEGSTVPILSRALLLAALALTTACGQVGPLYPPPPADDRAENAP